MKVAIILPEMLPVPPVRGGAVEHWVHTTSQGLAAAGVEVSIVSRPAGVKGAESIEYIGIPWTNWSLWMQSLKERLSKKNPLRTMLKLLNVSLYGIKLTNMTRKYDVICIENDPNLLFFVQKRVGQRLVLHMHNEHLGLAFLRPFYRRALTRTDLVICVSDYIRRKAISLFPEHADKFVVLLNAVDSDFFHPKNKAAVREVTNLPKEMAADRIILYVGRVTPEKGLHVLLSAFELVSSRISDARLVVVGSSFFRGAATTAYQRDMAKSAERYGRRVHFTGFLAQEQVRDLYAAADVVVAPAIWQEPCSLAVLEAMASGTPLVATRTGGTPELMLDSSMGELVAPNDEKSLADAIIALLQDPECANSIGQRARAHVRERHSWSHLVSKLRNHLEGRS